MPEARMSYRDAYMLVSARARIHAILAHPPNRPEDRAKEYYLFLSEEIAALRYPEPLEDPEEE